MSIETLIQILIDSLQYISVLSLVTMGIVLIFKTSFTTNFAQGSISTFGAFTTTILATNLNIPLVISILIGVASGFVIGVLIDILLFRRAKYVTFVGKQIITMGLVFVITGLIPIIFGVIPIPAKRFANGTDSFTLFNSTFSITNHAKVSIIITLLILGLLFVALRFTKWGLGVRATAANETVAGMMGINTRMISALSWGIAGGLGAIAAIMYAPLTQINPSLMISDQVNGFLASILGGFGTFFGPIVGVIIIELASSLFTYINSIWANVFVYLLILIIILIKPMGLFGKRIAKKV